MDRPAPGLRLETITPPRAFPSRQTAYLSASNGPNLHPRLPQDSYRFGRSTANGTLAPYSVCTSSSTPPTKSEHSPPHQYTWPGSIRRDRHRRNGPRTPRLPKLHLPPLPKPKAPPKRLCAQSYGPLGRNETGFVANSSTLERRSRTTGSFRRSDRNWRRTVTRLANDLGWRKRIESISPKKSTHRFRLILNHLRRMLHRLRLLQAYSRQLLALLRGPNHASSSSTPPPGQGPTVNPGHWVPPTQAPENTDAPAPPTLRTSMAHPFTSPFPPPPAPTAVPLPPAAFLTSDQVLSAPPPISIPAPAMVYTVPPPTVFPAPSAPAPTHLQSTELPPYPSLQPHVGLSYQAPPPINTTFPEPSTPTHAAQFASPTHFFPEADAEQERRLKRMEETIRALQANDARPDARYGDCSLFPGMRLPSNFKIPEFKTYGDLSRKFIDQYRYCAKAPPTLLELSTKEMARGQRFEEYGTKWRAQAAKHIPPISEAQQVQLFHSTLRGIYYSHLLAHTSSFSDLIEAGKKLDLGIKLERMEVPASKGEESSKKVPATSPSSGRRRGKEHQPQSIYYSAPPVPPTMTLEPYGHYTLASAQPPQPRPPVSRAPPPAQQNPTSQGPQADSKVPWTYEGSIGSVEQQFSVMGVTRSGRVYENPAIRNKGKAPATEVGAVPESSPFPSKKVTEEEAEAFMKIVKASEYKKVEQMAKSPTHVSLLALLLGSEPHREALLRVLTTAQVPKGTPPDRIDETVGSIFSNTISFSDDELQSEGWSHSRALHIVCKCNNYIIGRVMIDNGSALNVCPVTILKQMNVDLNRVRPSKTAVLDIPNAFSLLLGRPWIYSVGSVPSSLHQRLKFIVEEKLITERFSYATITFPAPASGSADKGSAALLKSKSTSTGGDSAFAPPVMKSSRPAGATTFIASPHTTGGSTGALQSSRYRTSSPGLHTPSGAPLTALPRTPTTLLPLRQPWTRLHSNPNPRHFDSNPFQEHLGEPQPIYFEEGLPEDSQVPEIEESLRRLEDHQITSVEPIEEINMGTEEEPRTLKIGTALDPTQRTRMIDFLKEYQEVFAWSYADMPGLDPSIVEHFLPLDTEKFPPKRQQLRRQRASLLLRIKEEVVKQINAGFLEVFNYSEWVANIVPVEKKDGRVRVYVDYRDLNKASPKDNFPLPHIDPPILIPPAPNRPLILYLTVRRQSLGCMLGQEDESTRTERVIYYLSKKFTEGESNYPEIEKMCCALVWVMQRLRQYTLYHTICLLSKADPLRYLLDSPFSMRNIAKWRCQLMEYDIEYVPRTSIKGQAIADHLAEFPIDDDTPINTDFPNEGILQI
ncbi:hypothetical protein CRG98_035037, partial [Punica granatum]